MNEREAMAILVAAVPAYGRREMALRAAGSAQGVLAEPGAYLRQLGEAGVCAVREKLASSERLFAVLRRSGTQLLLRGEPGYPARLMQIPNAPQLLFVQGRSDLTDACPLAVVGTRTCSEYGMQHAREIAGDLARDGVCVVSGLALGIDACAHRGALDAGGRTVAVLGGSLDKMYPRANLSLMREIALSGGSVVSEYPPGTYATRYSFLHRNRIIAGMSLGVLVVEGARRSGALNTAQHALEYGREVFALPGSVDNPASALPHMLIGEGAHLITCAQDILNMLVDEPAAQESKSVRVKRGQTAHSQKELEERRMPDHLDEAQQRIWHALEGGEMDFDALCEKTQIDAQELGALLMMLDMDGVVKALPGLRYTLA